MDTRAYAWRQVAVVLAGVLGVVGTGLAVLLFVVGVDPLVVLRDPLAVAETETGVQLSPLTGLVSSLGVLAWAAAATASALGAAVLRGRPAAGPLARAAVLSALLCLDDLFLVHEQVGDQAGRAAESTVLAGLGVLAAAHLWSGRDHLRSRPLLPLLAVAVAALGGSVLLDVALDSLTLEDTCKAVGVLAWAAFHVGDAVSACREALPEPARAAAASREPVTH